MKLRLGILTEQGEGSWELVPFFWSSFKLIYLFIYLSTQEEWSPGAESGPRRPGCSRRAPSWVARERKPHSRLNMARSRATAGSNVAPSGSAIQASVAPRTT